MKKSDFIRKEKQMNRISKPMNALFTTVLSVCALLIVLPVALMIIISFSSTDSIQAVGYNFFPQEWSLEGYRYLLKMGDQIVDSYMVTVAYSVLGTILSLIVVATYSYVISRKEFWLERFLTWLLFFTMLFGGGLVPHYMFNTRYYHLKDTFWILILANMFTANWVIIFRTFIKTTVPEELFDSAKIDGAGHFRIFSQIVVPLSKPGLGTIGLFSFVSKWNEWFTGMLYIQNPKLVPLQTLLTKLQNNVDYIKNNAEILGTEEGLQLAKNLPSTNLRMACTVVAVLPVLLAYPYFQRYFVGGLTVGSIKG